MPPHPTPGVAVFCAPPYAGHKAEGGARSLWLGLLFLLVLVLVLLLYWFLPVEEETGPEPRVVLLVQNGERQVEGVVRALVAQRDRHRAPGPILVWDLASTDETGAILARLQRQFTGLQVAQAPAPTLAEAIPPAESPLVMLVDLRQPLAPGALWGLLARIWK